MDILARLGIGTNSNSQNHAPMCSMPKTESITSRYQSVNSYFSVPRGQFTFDQEGLEAPGSRYHSRSAHIPSNSSGITLGRGFDLGHNSAGTIWGTLAYAGFGDDQIQIALNAAGLKGERARSFLEHNPFSEVTPEQQYHLFNRSFSTLEADVRRIISKPDTVAKYGSVDWDALPVEMRDMIVDLRYRGDYTPTTRQLLQPYIVAKDLYGFSEALADRNYWVGNRGVPRQRFEARASYLGR
jgi:hypothetical protein